MTGFGLLYDLLNREGKMEIHLLQSMIKQCNILISLAAQEGDKVKLKQFSELLESIEDSLQLSWGFAVDRTRHIHWLNNVDCKCPKLDNQDMWGTGERIYSGNCPVHNYKIKELEEAQMEANMDKPVKKRKTKKKKS